MKIRLILFSIIGCFFAGSLYSGNPATNDESNFKIVFYNVENLFDTLDDPAKEDNEFLPTAPKQWNSSRYMDKLTKIAKIMTHIGGNEWPEVIGFCEIENRAVLADLVSKTDMKEAEYGIVHEESPDVRGIDVGLIYRKDAFTYQSHEAIPIVFPFAKEYKTRDILYVKGTVKGGTNVHLFVNHWSSRRGGLEKTEPRRTYSAEVLKKKTQAILKEDPDAYIVMMGDFNDEPMNKSMSKVLDAGNDKTKTKGFYNLMYDKQVNKEGSYNYRGNWNALDQLIISYSFFADKGLSISHDGASIFKPEWILYHNKKYDYYTPNRTYGGNKYFGGYSDHLPVFLNMTVK